MAAAPRRSASPRRLASNPAILCHPKPCRCCTWKLSSEPMGRVHTSGVAPRLLMIMSTVRKKLAPMRSILFTKQMRCTWQCRIESHLMLTAVKDRLAPMQSFLFKRQMRAMKRRVRKSAASAALAACRNLSLKALPPRRWSAMLSVEAAKGE